MQPMNVVYNNNVMTITNSSSSLGFSSNTNPIITWPLNFLFKTTLVRSVAYLEELYDSCPLAC